MTETTCTITNNRPFTSTVRTVHVYTCMTARPLLVRPRMLYQQLLLAKTKQNKTKQNKTIGQLGRQMRRAFGFTDQSDIHIQWNSDSQTLIFFNLPITQNKSHFPTLSRIL